MRLLVRTERPLTGQQLEELQGGRWDVRADGRPRSRTLDVTMRMDAGDPAGGLLRAQNVVLDQVPGRVVHAELDETGPRMPRRRRR